MRFERRMTDAEAMMWNVEKDPWLSSNFGTVTILDRPVDFEIFRKRIASAVAEIPRMRERVVPTLGRLAPPSWQPDPEFRLDYHVRRVALPAPGSDRQLFDVAALLLQDPPDRTRPLWQFVAIDGLSEGRGALFVKMHHTITDGKGGIRLAERYMEIERDTAPPVEVDLDQIVADSVRAETSDSANGQAEDERPGGVGGLALSVRRVAGHRVRRQLGRARRVAGELTLVVNDPGRLLEFGSNTVKMVQSARSQLSSGEPSGGSPIWRDRSRHRHFEALTVPFEPAKQASASLGGSLNDFFVTGAVIGAARYHDKVGAEASSFNLTFVVSTRQDSAAGGNAFTPSKISAPADAMDPAERFAAVREAMARRRGEIVGGGPMSAVAGIANLMPTSTMTGIARSQAGRIDFATSNVRAAPFELFISGAKVLAPYPMGPVAGTAWNITLMTYNGVLFMGVHIDPMAVTDPVLLRQCLEDGFEELLLAGGARGSGAAGGAA
jgi:diacylglycerol O-acyltransferase